MTDTRPPNWDWVKAIGTCEATVMFGVLKTLAEQNVATRNSQLGQQRFQFHDVDGITFAVSKPTVGDLLGNQVVFKVSDDLQNIKVSFGRVVNRQGMAYEVKLNDEGVCKLRADGTDFDPWQVLKVALEPLLFG